MQYNDFILNIEGSWEEGFSIGAVHKYVDGNLIKKQESPEPFPSFDARPFFHNQRLSKVFKEIETAIHRQPFDHQFLTSYGEEMFRGLFTQSISTAFENARFAARLSRRGLRVRLHLPSVLQVLPWELMFIPEESPPNFLCLIASIAVTRAGRSVEAESVQTIEFPLRILVVVSAPVNSPPLNTRAEINRLLESLSSFISSGKVEIDFVHGADTLNKLKRLMEELDYHIVHFIGHTSDASRGAVSLIFEDEERNERKISATNLFQQLGNVALPSLIFLNACKGASTSLISPLTSIAESFLAVGVPAVIAHQFEISDEAAEVFARHIYDGLVDGIPVEDAIAAARYEVYETFALECFTPVFFLQSTNGILFLTQSGSEISELNAFRFTDKAQKATRLRRWSEAADYAKAALFVDPENEELKSFLEAALQEEELDNYLHQATFSTSVKDWNAVVSWCDKYLESPLLQTRPKPERTRVAQMKLDIYLHQARKASRIKEWADAVNWYERYIADPVVQEQPASRLNQVALMRRVALLGAGVRDPYLRWKG